MMCGLCASRALPWRLRAGGSPISAPPCRIRRRRWRASRSAPMPATPAGGGASAIFRVWRGWPGASSRAPSWRMSPMPGSPPCWRARPRAWCSMCMSITPAGWISACRRRCGPWRAPCCGWPAGKWRGWRMGWWWPRMAWRRITAAIACRCAITPWRPPPRRAATPRGRSSCCISARFPAPGVGRKCWGPWRSPPGCRTGHRRPLHRWQRGRFLHRGRATRPAPSHFLPRLAAAGRYGAAGGQRRHQPRAVPAGG